MGGGGALGYCHMRKTETKCRQFSPSIGLGLSHLISMQNASRAYNKKIANISGSIRLTSQKKLEISNLLIQGNIILEFGKLRNKITLKEHFRKLIAQPEDEFDVGMSSKYYSPNPILINSTSEYIKLYIQSFSM